MTEEKKEMTEDERVLRILRTAPDEPPLPSTVDVARTMSEGSRRRRVHRWSGGVALVAVTAVAAGGGTVAVAALRDGPNPVPTTTATSAPATVAAAPPPVPRDCRVTLLPSGGITKALVTAGDPSGRYLAGRVYPSPGGVRTVLWKDGALRSLPPMPGADATFHDINSSGVAVGYSFDGDIQHAYVLEGDAVKRLRGGRTVAAGINDQGVIVGTLGEPFFSGVPVRWTSSGAAPTKLALPSGVTRGDAVAIGEDGTVVGSIYRQNHEGTAYLWLPDGTGRLLPRPNKADYFWADSISNGWLFGRAVFDAADGSSRSFTSYRYSIATGKFEKLAAELSPTALGAENGWVLGTTTDPVIVAGTKVVKLPRYKKLKEYQMTAFSADGKTAAGYSSDTTATEAAANRPLRWTCR